MDAALPAAEIMPREGAAAVLVLGMHRSGTSAVAQFIGRLGAALPSQPVPPGADNPAGFWEPEAVVQANDALLSGLNSAWLDLAPPDLARLSPNVREAFIAKAATALGLNFAGAASYVLKDPRLCRLLPLYREVLARVGSRPRAVLVLRAPGEIAASLAARDQLSANVAGVLWARHMIEAERHSRDLPRAFVRYDGLLHDWRAVAETLMPLLEDEVDARDAQPGAALHPELRHYDSADAPPFHPRLRDLLAAIQSALLSLAERDDAEGRAVLDRLASALDDAVRQNRDAFAAEFHYQRLAARHDTARPRNPDAVRAEMAGALDRLQSAGWAAQPPSRPCLPAPNPQGKVGLFLAGVQKGGTTSLFELLRRHPQLAAPGRKETHFFDDESLGWPLRDERPLHDWYDADSAGRLRFDATPIYAFWAPALDRILAYNHAARFILLFRDPVARAVSHWRMERGRGAEDLGFAEAVRAEPQRLAAAPAWSRAWREHSYVARGRYGEQLARLLSRFPRDQMLLQRSDELHRDQGATLARIAAFLGIDPFPDMPAMHALEGESRELADTAAQDAVRRLLADDMRCFSALSGLDVSDWLPR